ncbi:thioesterase superfamily protein [Tanacetum coccineum]|uniref:Thioesterase superfamily protein n=1 Tax=Tanacetum coccineum TaxID=301880 RepID=A0ABQ4ZQA0_9ASTR
MYIPCVVEKLREDDMKKGDYSKLARIWLENSSKFELDGLALKGMKIDCVELGYIRCYFVIPHHLSDGNGNCNTGAMLVLIDDMAAGAAFSITGGNLATVNFTMSFYSTVKVNEEVEIEASVVGEKGSLVSVIIDIKKERFRRESCCRKTMDARYSY